MEGRSSLKSQVPIAAAPRRADTAGMDTKHIDQKHCWNAVTGRDASQDGRFVFGVKTTGVYCRPSCPARRPLRRNVVFFATAAGARADGFRACKRCDPDGPGQAQRHAALVQRACELIDEAESPPPLNRLARALNCSGSHLQRTFKSVLGVTPRQYAAQARSGKLASGLRREASVTDAIFAAGFDSASSAYDSARATLGMTPGQYRRGGEHRTISYATVTTTLGWLLVAATEDGVCCIEFGDAPEALQRGLVARFPNATVSEDNAMLAPWVRRIAAYLKTPSAGLELPLDIQGTAFQQRVWRALRAIDAGQTASYREVAEAIGQPSASRAVAQACAANPVALAVPCHRVVRSDGASGGYRWGPERKARLLQSEARTTEPSSK